MLRLEMATDPKWVKHIVEGNIEEILTDHAYCEQKAASTAISLIVQYPEHAELVEKMADLAQEEMGHFKMVFRLIQQRGYSLGRERKDSYVNELAKFLKVKGKGREETLADKLLFAAMIEARSCERFSVLSENIDDTMFLQLARTLCPNVDVEGRWRDFLTYEAKVIQNYGKTERIHG